MNTSLSQMVQKIFLISLISLGFSHVAKAQSVTVVTSTKQFDTLVAQAHQNNSVVLIDFYADWCGPCRGMTPIFTAAAQECKKCVFIKINIDNLKDIASKYSIRSIPTFLLIKDTKVVGRLSGSCTKSKLIESVRKAQK